MILLECFKVFMMSKGFSDISHTIYILSTLKHSIGGIVSISFELCIILFLKDQSINGSVFEDLKKEDIDVLGFNFGACKILLKVLKQVIYS